MSALTRKIIRSTRPTLKTSNRWMQNAANIEAFENNASEDQPVEMENPFGKEQRECVLCRLKIEPDYKNVRLLSQFQSSHTGRIYGKNITGLCKLKQMKVEAEILKAQNAGMMGYYLKDPKYVKDPKLFDPNNPFRSHKY